MDAVDVALLGEGLQRETKEDKIEQSYQHMDRTVGYVS